MEGKAKCECYCAAPRHFLIGGKPPRFDNRAAGLAQLRSYSESVGHDEHASVGFVAITCPGLASRFTMTLSQASVRHSMSVSTDVRCLNIIVSIFETILELLHVHARAESDSVHENIDGTYSRGVCGVCAQWPRTG